MKNKQETIFDFDEKPEWAKEWQNMPEFNQEDLTSNKSIIVHFENEKDMKDFAKLVGQTITPRTQSIWYPKATITRYSDKRYVDES